jgi:HEAT repeat protein
MVFSIVAFSCFGCAVFRPYHPGSEQNMTANAKDVLPPSDDIELHLRFLMDPFGDEPHRRQRELSVHYLLAHADRAYPRLLQALQANPVALNSPSIIEVLPLFARSDSVPILEDIMRRGVEQVSSVAGQALGRHPDAGAKDALLRGLKSRHAEVIAAATDGLMVRGDPSACSDLKLLVRHENPNVRYHAAHAASKLGCLDRSEIEELSSVFPDLRELF